MMLGNWSISVGNPWWLILIPLVLPPLVWTSYRSLAGLGPVRRALAILFRTAVITLIVLALAELQSVRRTDRLATIFLLDASNSVPREQQKAALDYVTEASKKRRQGRPGRRGGLRQGAAGRGPPCPERAQPAGHREHDRPREHRPGRGGQAGAGVVSRRHGPAHRRALRRQRESRQPVRAGPDRQVAGRAGRRPADRVLLRPRGPGREGLDSARRQEGRDGQHQRRDPRQRADAGNAPGLSEGRQLPGAGRRQRAAGADRARSAASTS